MFTSILARAAAVTVGVALAGTAAVLAAGPTLATVLPLADALPSARTAMADTAPYGACKLGFVWRNAGPGDHVCVTAEHRDRTAIENADGPRFRQPGGGAYGPDTCRAGFVWRDAFAGDTVCVTPNLRDEAHQDNALADSRKGPTAVPSSTPAPKPPRTCNDDGYSAAPSIGGSPVRYKSGSSPVYLGARWDRCAHQVQLNFGGVVRADVYNVRVDGRQFEVAGGRGGRVYTVSDDDPAFYAEGVHRIVVQACNKGSGPFSHSSCTAWSPEVALSVHMGSVSQY